MRYLLIMIYIHSIGLSLTVLSCFSNTTFIIRKTFDLNFVLLGNIYYRQDIKPNWEEGGGQITIS